VASNHALAFHEKEMHREMAIDHRRHGGLSLGHDIFPNPPIENG
jgi:hypothetical protein